MAARQGYADIFLRKQSLVVCAVSPVEGSADQDGLWSSGFTVDDFDAYCATHPTDITDSSLGASVRQATRLSRLGVKWPDSWDENDPNWSTGPNRQRLATAFGLEDDRALFTGMVSVAAYSIGDQIGVVPTRRKRGGWFDVFQDPWREAHKTIELPGTVSDSELGQAIRIGLSRSL